MAKEHKSKKRRLRDLGIILASFVLVGMLGAGAFAFALGNIYNSNRNVLANPFPSSTDRPATTTGEAAKAVNILVIGSDSKTAKDKVDNNGKNQSADAILVLHVSGDRTQVYGMSVLPDTYVSIPGHGKGPISQALKYGGISLLDQTVEKQLDVRMDQIAIVSFQGFSKITDALGGIIVNNPVEFSSKSYNYPKGYIQMDGSQALSYVRESAVFATTDTQRAENQQAFVAGVLDTVISKGTLLDPFKITDTVSSISPYMTVTSGMDAAYLAGLGYSLKSLNSADVDFLSFPTDGTKTVSGNKVALPDAAKLSALQKAFRGDKLSGYSS